MLESAYPQTQLCATLKRLTLILLYASIMKKSHCTQGMAQLINKLFAERLQTSFTYVNREEDCGSSGLRQAKQSYQPTKMVEKFNVDLPQRLEAASCMETETTRKCDASPNDW